MDADYTVLNPGSTLATDGDSGVVNLGVRREQLVSDLMPTYGTLVSRGLAFIGSTAAAGVIPPIFNSTAQTFMIWNPSGSGKIVVPLALHVGLVTVGVVTSNFCYGYQANAGSSLATAAPISALTQVDPVNANLGHSNRSVTRFAPATATVLAPSFLRSCGLSNFMASTPAAANMFWQQQEFLNGDIIVGPGSALFVANNIAGVATYNISMTWAELPV